jgi:hypothetical protein
LAAIAGCCVHAEFQSSIALELRRLQIGFGAYPEMISRPAQTGRLLPQFATEWTQAVSRYFICQDRSPWLPSGTACAIRYSGAMKILYAKDRVRSNPMLSDILGSKEIFRGQCRTPDKFLTAMSSILTIPKRAGALLNNQIAERFGGALFAVSGGTSEKIRIMACLWKTSSLLRSRYYNY